MDLTKFMTNKNEKPLDNIAINGGLHQYSGLSDVSATACHRANSNHSKWDTKTITIIMNIRGVNSSRAMPDARFIIFRAAA